MTVTHYLQTGGFDLWFTLPALSTGQWVAVQCDSALTQADLALSSPTGTIKLAKTASGYEFSLIDSEDVEIEAVEVERASGETAVRVTVRNQAISICMDGAWVMTLFAEAVRHAEVSAVYLLASGSITVTEVLLAELGHGRDTIQVEVESTGWNVVSAVIGDRPIKTWARYDGTINFAYDPPESVGYVLNALSVEWEASNQGKAASDALIFHEHLALALDEQTLRDVGFVTRALRFAGLEHGAIVAASKLLEEGRQARRKATVTIRLRPEFEMYDLAQVWVGDGRGIDAVSERVLVERLQVNVGDDISSTIGGRAA